MTEKNLNQKIKILERDVFEIKRYLGSLGVLKADRDFENWQRIKRFSRKIRKKLFQEKYPRLYGKLAKRR